MQKEALFNEQRSRCKPEDEGAREKRTDEEVASKPREREVHNRDGNFVVLDNGVYAFKCAFAGVQVAQGSRPNRDRYKISMSAPEKKLSSFVRTLSRV